MNGLVHVFLLIFAFLFAQAGVAAHEVSHLAPVGHSQDNGLPQASACELCVAFSQLSGCAPFPAASLAALCMAPHESPHAFEAFIPTRVAFQARARAPPVFP